MNSYEARAKVVEAGKRLVESKLIARTWGNVSCRISDSHFVITPSGRDYISLTPDDIVEVRIDDCSYAGVNKPSSEKGIHAETYRQYPEANFVIHTHQDQASVVSTLGLDAMPVPAQGGSPLLGSEIRCAAYGLPSTKKLRRGVADALKRSTGQAVIMKYHGALCFGKDDEEAFQVALALEEACERFVAEHYLQSSKRSEFDADAMRRYALAQLNGQAAASGDEAAISPYREGERIERGFRLIAQDGGTVEVDFDALTPDLPPEATLYNAVFKRHPQIKHIVHACQPSIATASKAGITVRPLLDDFAQLAGTKVATVAEEPPAVASALKSASAVFLLGRGALCCGATRSDALAVGMVMEKNCKSLVGAALFGHIKPIHPLECHLMRFIYLRSYSKKATNY